MSDQTQAMQQQASDDAALDAAIASHDERRIAYEYARRARRWRMVFPCYLVFLLGGSGLIGASLTSDDIARRVAANSSVIGMFMMTLAGMVSVYWGTGAYESGNAFGGSGLNSMYGMNSMYRGPGGGLLGPLRSSRAD